MLLERAHVKAVPGSLGRGILAMEELSGWRSRLGQLGEGADMKRGRLGVIIGVTVAMLTIGSPLGASAFTSTVSGTRPAAPLNPVLPRAGTKASDTTVFAGYEVTTGSSSVVDTFKVPNITCTSATTGIGPGAFMVAGPTDDEVFDAVDTSLECSNGDLLVGEYVIVNNIDTLYSDPVSPGDTIKASVSITSTTTNLSIGDLTKAHEFTLTGSGAGASADAEFAGIDTLSDTSGVLPVPADTSGRFTSTTVGGLPLTTSSPTPLALTSGCALVLTANPIEGGTNFTVEPPPISIMGLSPTSGPTGTSVTISGTGFNSTSTVRFNGKSSKDVVYTSSSQLEATVPTGATSGPVSVTNSTAPVGTGRSLCDYEVTS